MAHRRNPLPKTPPKRSYGLQRPARAGGSSSLDRTRHMMREHEKSARPFDPSKRGSWQGSGRDLVVNPRQSPRLKSGYAYEASDQYGADVRAVPNDEWDTVMISESDVRDVSWRGFIEIDGSECAVFAKPGGGFYAQLAHMTRNAVVNRRQPPRLKPGYAYEASDQYGADVRAVPNDEWDTVMISESDVRDVSWRGFIEIDGSECAVFAKPGGGFYAQLAHMTRNAGARDGAPEHLKAIRFRGRSEKGPTENGESLPYNSWDSGTDDDGDQWYLVEYATGSDYSGALIYRANYLELSEMLDSEFPAGESPAVWGRTHGGHGTYGIIVVWDKLSDDIVEVLNGLEDYPLISEDRHSELVMEMEGESWENWAKGDFEKAFIKELNSELDGGEVEEWPEGVDSYPLFRMAMESSNSEWIEEDSAMGSGLYVDLKRVVPDAVALVLESKPVSKYISADDVQYLAELDKALGLEKK